MYGVDLSVQFGNLMPALGLGFILAFVYDILIFIRKTILTGKVFQFLTDMIFVMLCTVSSVLLFIAVNSGHIRSYLVLAEIFAAVVYRMTAGVLITAITDRISYCLKKITVRIYSPFRRVGEVLLSVSAKNKEKFRKILKKFKINSKNPLKDDSEL